MDRVVLARHGESERSVAGLTNGDPRIACALTAEGREEARRLGLELANEPIDLCVTSEFERARETADIALAGRDVPRLVLREAADAYADARGRAARGRVLVGVLDQLGADACLLDRILAAGVYAGCWGTVTRWDRASRGVRGQVFPGRGAPAG